MTDAPTVPIGGHGEDDWDWTALRAACAREAGRLGLDGHDADEVAQESVLRAWRHRASCRQRDAPLPWLLGITRRETWRLLHRRRVRSTREHPEEEPGAGVAEAAPAHAAMVRLDVIAAVRRLDRRDRELVHARYMADMPVAAVADLLGVPEGTAKVRLHRARHRLRELLGPAHEASVAV